MSIQGFSTYPEVYFGELKRNYIHHITHTYYIKENMLCQRDVHNGSSNHSKREVNFHSCAIKIMVSALG